MSTKKVAVLNEFSWQNPAKDADLTTSPGTPTKGDRYIIAGTLTNSDILTGGTATASTTNGGLVASRACDNDEGTSWENDMVTAGDQWWKYDLGAAVTKTVRKLRIKCLSGSVIKDFSLQGSNNNSSWDTLYTGLQANNDSWQNYVIPNSTAYRYYRIYMTSAYSFDGTTLYLDLTEIEMTENIAWSEHVTEIAVCTVGGATPTWEFVVPVEGYICWVEDINLFRIFNGTSWMKLIEVINVPHGCLSDSTTQTITGATGAAYAVKFDTDEIKENITHSTSVNNSRISFPIPGNYLITFSAICKSSTPNVTIDLWVRVDGADIPRSNTISKFVGSANERLITITFIYKFTANQYFEIMWCSSDSGTVISATGTQTNPTRPACPSIICTINMVGV